MCDNRFYRCAACGTTVGMIHDGGHPLSCCGREMEHLLPNTTDSTSAGWPEKHLPVLRVHKKFSSAEECCGTPDTAVCAPGGCEVYTVDVGETHHPMDDDHAIRWIYLQTTVGGQRKCLSPGAVPHAAFALTEEKPTAVYAYCDKHGLYMTKL